ncbi:MAG: hydroxymethylbutenyl pyrophosphate reductase [Bacteroidetes bacterium]|nr:hydroxymethylbutenyl pyrophosphate reductase [Bacteroidota bacterium]
MSVFVRCVLILHKFSADNGLNTRSEGDQTGCRDSPMNIWQKPITMSYPCITYSENKHMIKIEMDTGSGFCFGVVNAIKKAEQELDNASPLYCLGDIVHNGSEVERLNKRGLQIIEHEEFDSLKNVRVLFRAHGEPPSTYLAAKANHIQVIDATCPVVLKLQQRIKHAYETHPHHEWQIVIYGKIGHAEVNGLVGQTGNTAIVVEHWEDLDQVDMNKNICLFAQTTKSISGFNNLVETIKKKINPAVSFEFYDTICRQVSNRIPNIRTFAVRHDIVFFVSGTKSSNGKALFDECKAVNPNSHLISTPEDITPSLLKGVSTAGICGATSTPKWLMEEVAKKLEKIASVTND